MKTAVYVRVSTDEQAKEGFSTKAQIEKLKNYIQIKDWEFYKVYADEGISGKNITDRPAINELLEDINSGLVNNVLVYKIDRLTRNEKDLIDLMDIFREHNCAFNSLMESDTRTEVRKFIFENEGKTEFLGHSSLDKVYSVCKDCHQEKAPTKGCLVEELEINGKVYKRIPAGYEEIPFIYEDGICHDCNAGFGQYHHCGCDCEECPACHEQLIGCDCEIEIEAI